jgi:hypothetical protein
MSLKVIGAGFGRTGTMSLKLALEELGLGPCYHMLEVVARPEHDAMWLALANGETSDWRPMLAGFGSTVDWPSTFIWERLAKDNPDAKIVLTLRNADAWYRSCAATIFGRMEDALRDPPADPVRSRHMQMVNTIIVEKTFGGSLAKEHAIGVFNAHNEAVRRTVPKERLLAYESGEGWEPLCDFLGVPVPTTPYPAANTGEDFLLRFPVRR